MTRGRLLASLAVVAATAMALAMVLALIVAGWLAWQRPEHVVAWLGLMRLCGP